MYDKNVSFRSPSGYRQSGIALVIALIVLVAMTLASVGMVRSIDTAVMITGNMAFRQGATIAGDAGIEAARTWLMSNSALLNSDSSSNGYYATSQDSADLTGNRTPGITSDDVGWSGGGVASPICLTADAASNTVCYVIHRLCNAAGALNAATCSTQQTEKSGSSLGGKRQMETYQEGSWSEVATMAYYRITVRIAGPRNNVSFIQTFLLI
jgi:Tfp pilus assembly protein PilX